MRLQSAHVTKYKSVNDSMEFTLDSDITALVGKNEAGKTAALEALYRLNPLVSGHPTKFEELRDYPRRHRARDKTRIDQARPVRATFELEQADIDAVAEQFGTGAFTADTVTIHRQYDSNTVYFDSLTTNTLAAAQHLVAKAGLDVGRFAQAKNVAELITTLRGPWRER